MKRLVLPGALALAMSGTVHAQWSVTVLTPPGTQFIADAQAVGAGQQGGYAYDGADTRPGIWTGTAGSWVDLLPAGFEDGGVSDIHNGVQVGSVSSFGGTFAGQASLWTGTAASWIDLHPPSTLGSTCYGVGGGRQVGYADVGGVLHASIWSGSSASWLDLHPPAAALSVAYDVDATGAQQVGYATLGTVDHACLWMGTAASWVDLHPAGADFSYANDVDGGVQGGQAYFGGTSHAGVWSGSASSWVDLHPAGLASASQILGVNGNNQVGTVQLIGQFTQSAALWSGSVSTFVDLHASLPNPSTWSDTYASSVWSDSFSTYVVGSGFNSATGIVEAILWTRANGTTAFCFGTASACPCANGGAAGRGCANSINTSGALLVAVGGASVASDTVTLQGNGMPNSTVLYLQGTAQLNGGLGVSFGDGLRCVGGSIVRLGIKTNVAGASQYPAPGDPSVSVRGGVPPSGGVRTYQTWYRNSAVFCTSAAFNLSNGVQITWVP